MTSRKHSHRKSRKHSKKVSADPIHSDALDGLSADDAEWFQDHPDRSERYRVLREHELCDPSHFPTCVPVMRQTPEITEAGGFWCVLVTQLGPGLRKRQFFEAGGIPLDENGDFDPQPPHGALDTDENYASES